MFIKRILSSAAAPSPKNIAGVTVVSASSVVQNKQQENKIHSEEVRKVAGVDLDEVEVLEINEDDEIIQPKLSLESPDDDEEEDSFYVKNLDTGEMEYVTMSELLKRSSASSPVAFQEDPLQNALNSESFVDSDIVQNEFRFTIIQKLALSVICSVFNKRIAILSSRAFGNLRLHALADSEVDRVVEQLSVKNAECQALEHENLSLRIAPTNEEFKLKENLSVVSKDEFREKEKFIELLKAKGVDPDLIFGTEKCFKEEPVYGPFLKMLAAKVPRPAVEAKMISKSLNLKYLDYDPNGSIPDELQSKEETVGDELKCVPLVNMLADSVPRDQVETKMKEQELDHICLNTGIKTNPMENESLLLKNDPVYIPFFKMLSVNVPRGAVELEMKQKGLDPKYLDMDPETVMESEKEVVAESLLLKNDPVYIPFFKMLSVNVPRGAVEMKMKQKGLDPKYLDMDPETSMLQETSKKIAIKDDERYAPFFKMLSVNVPRGAVEMKMKQKGLDVSYLDKDPNSLIDDSPVLNQVLLKDDERYTPFFKMLSVNVPRGAVEMKMRQKGLDVKYLDMDPESTHVIIEAEASKPVVQTVKAPEKKPDKIVRRKLHWKKINNRELDKYPDCLWNSTNKFTFEQRELKELNICFTVNISAQEREKEKKKQEVKLKEGTDTEIAARPKKRVEKQILLETQRSNNISIVLSRMKQVNAKAICSYICSLEIDEDVISSEDVRTLLSLVPTPDEEKLLKEFNGDRSNLGSAETYFLEIMRLPRYKQRINCYLYKLKFDEIYYEAKDDFTLLKRGCQELLESRKFKKLLEIILALGNFMNEGEITDPHKWTQGFSMEALLKLRGVKSFTGGTTALHYLVLLIQSRQRDILSFIKSETDNIRAATNCSLANASAQLGLLNNGIRILQNEHKIVAETIADPVKKESMTEDDMKFSFNLNKFYMTAKENIETLTELGAETETVFKKTLEYLCEDHNTTSEQFFRNLQAFFADFELGLNENDAARQKFLKKRQREMEKNSKKTEKPRRSSANKNKK